MTESNFKVLKWQSQFPVNSVSFKTNALHAMTPGISASVTQLLRTAV
jgi:hypothetical protein